MPKKTEQTPPDEPSVDEPVEENAEEVEGQKEQPQESVEDLKKELDSLK